MADNSDVPPLEDMSELINQVERLSGARSVCKSGEFHNGEHKKQVHSSKGLLLETKSKPDQIPLPKNRTETSFTPLVCSNKHRSCEGESTNSKPAGSKGFGGMQKGFLFGGKTESSNMKPASKSSIPKTVKTEKLDEDLPYIKPKTDSGSTDNLHFAEVQQAMNTTQGLLKDSAWITDDLVDRMEKNAIISKHLQDPLFVKAIGEFQKNPMSALTKYQENQEVQLFFQEFCGLLGEHFITLSRQDPSTSPGLPDKQRIMVNEADGADISVHKLQKSEDDPQVQAILSDPDVCKLLQDPQIQSLFDQLRKSPDEGQRLLQEASSNMRKKIDKLIDAGLLQIR